MAARQQPLRLSPFDEAAAPVFQMLESFDSSARESERSLVKTGAALLDRFERSAEAAGALPASIKPARYGLAVLLDQRARSARNVRLSNWSVLANQALFESRDVSLDRIRDFHETARRQGGDFSDLERFLADVISRAEDRRRGHRSQESVPWGWRIAVGLIALFLALAGYSVFLEYRFHRQLSAEFRRELIGVGLDRNPKGAELVRRLDQLSEAVQRVRKAARRAPLRGVLRLPWVDSETNAHAVYLEAAAARVPRTVADAIELNIATEGDGLELYDALRAWSVLTGDDNWQPDYITGWLEDHEQSIGLSGLSRHAATLKGPEIELLAHDPVIMDQTRRFAAEVSEPDRAWLELLRAEGTRALARWEPDQVAPGLSDVVVRRSGRTLNEGMSGLFTAAGWTHARNYGIGLAVQKARQVARVVTGGDLPSEDGSPDLLLDRLHAETIDAWKSWLADLRVRPFSQRDTAIVVSGTLALADNPLTRLLQEVWMQSGGTDRLRSHPQQLVLAREFGPMIQYVEQGRMAEIARLFSSLNVALGTLELNQERGAERLMSLQDRSRSIEALKSAPRIVVQIAEDVLAQSSLPTAGTSSNPLTRQWQQLVYPSCRDILEGRYPFGDGPDANLDAVASILGPGATLTSFVNSGVLQFLETESSPWRWNPEARFAGLTPESAVFFERALLVSDALFDDAGQIRHGITLAALAERGETIFGIGGQGVPVRATGAPAKISWPGPVPELGLEVSFRVGADNARILYDGPWGLMRLVDGLRLRLRDEGKRVLLDLRSQSGRVFLEMGFEDAVNPISARNAIRGFSCPPVL